MPMAIPAKLAAYFGQVRGMLGLETQESPSSAVDEEGLFFQ